MPGQPGRGRSRTNGAPAARGTATPPGPAPAPSAADTAPARGVAALPETPDAGSGVDGATQMFQAPDVTQAIFVDHSGRRGRTLRRVVSALVLLALLLIVALWVSQGAEALGLRVPA